MRISATPVTISIIMATYNRAHFVEESLISIQNQSFQDWECLIIDDGSTDNSESIISLITAADPRFTYLKRPGNYKKGLPGCRNYALDMAKGEYFIFFDDDDIVHPENLSYCISLLNGTKYHFLRYEKRPFFGSSGSIAIKPIKDSRLTSFSNKDFEKMITGEIPFASCCVLWDKKCFEAEKFNERLMYAEEWECYSRILIAGYVGLCTNAVLYFNRKHPNSNTGEFQKNNPVRVNSQILAAKLVIQNLFLKKVFSDKLKIFFLRMGFELNSMDVIKKVLDAAGSNDFEKLKYQIGFKFYPVLKPIFYIKGKFKKS